MFTSGRDSRQNTKEDTRRQKFWDKRHNAFLATARLHSAQSVDVFYRDFMRDEAMDTWKKVFSVSEEAKTLDQEFPISRNPPTGELQCLRRELGPLDWQTQTVEIFIF